MIKLRQTIVNDYMTCPFKCYKNWGGVGERGHCEENESTQNKYSATGIALHEAMEIWGRDKLGFIREIQHYHEKLDEKFHENCPIDLFDNEIEREVFRDSLHEQLEWLMEQTDSNEIIAVEKSFEVENIFNGVEEPIIGTVDRIDGNLEARRATLIDYKSGKPYTKKKLATNVQALFYTLAFFKEYGFLPEKFVFFFSKHKKRQIVWITPEFLQDATAEFLGNYYKMVKGEWGPNPSNKFFCKNFCEHYKECPAHSKKKWNIEHELFNPFQNV